MSLPTEWNFPYVGWLCLTVINPSMLNSSPTAFWKAWGKCGHPRIPSAENSDRLWDVLMLRCTCMARIKMSFSLYCSELVSFREEDEESWACSTLSPMREEVLSCQLINGILLRIDLNLVILKCVWERAFKRRMLRVTDRPMCRESEPVLCQKSIDDGAIDLAFTQYTYFLMNN